MNLTAKEKQYLEIFQENGSLTITQVARMVGTGISTAGQRIRSLYQRGYLQRNLMIPEENPKRLKGNPYYYRMKGKG